MLWRSGLALILATSAACADPLTFMGRFTLGSELAGFGGLSAIEMQTGDSAIVLSDRGRAFALTIDRATPDITARAVRNPEPGRDSEGLAWAAGQLYFSYEKPAQVFDRAGGALPNAPDFDRFEDNRGFEALAGAPDGTLYAIPEGAVARRDPIPIYRFRGGSWTIFAFLPPPNGFLPVGADIGPDGQLYILSRSFSPLGFRSRITRLDPDRPNDPMVTLLTTRLGQFDNLEGLAIWQSASGATCLSMVSDDNFLSIQTTELVEYALTETLAGGATCD